MVGSVNVKAIPKHSSDAPGCSPSASPAAARSKRKIVHEAAATSGDSTVGDDAADAGSDLCRYKTGRCTNARVVKPNGALLLLCEFHRSQQNRTKKRSDMKYRQDRAKRRMVERQQVTESHPILPVSNTTPEDPDLRKSKKKLTRTHRNHRSNKLKVFSDLFQKSDCAFSMASPRKERGDSLFFTSRGMIHSGVLDLDLDDADITINSPSVRGSIGNVNATASVFPFCVSPLSSARRCGEPFWQPDDVRLLEYFIL